MSTKSENHLITEYFPALSRTRRRVTAKELALEQDKAIQLYLSKGCDPTNFRVHEFPAKGRGILAMAFYSKGSFLCEYAGDLIPVKEAKTREKKYEKEEVGCYMYYFQWKNSEWCVDATKPTSRIGRLINHSRRAPNCKTRVFVHNNRPHLVFVALRDIRPQEELLYDYGEKDRKAIEAHPWLATT